jgi:N-acetylmuramoyl-L-alanine amidase
MSPQLLPLFLFAFFSLGTAVIVNGKEEVFAEETRLKGTEIVAAGRFFDIGTRVVTWHDPSGLGYDAYRVERRFSEPYGSTAGWTDTVTENPSFGSPNRFGYRNFPSWAAQTADPLFQRRRRGGGWTLEELQAVVSQFVLHYDATGSAKRTFQVLHDQRDLSVHFMLDLDGTIYQTLDLKERAWHAGTANTRSVGVEIAHPGAFAAGASSTPANLAQWYRRNPAVRDNRTTIRVDAAAEWIYSGPSWVGGPDRDFLISGTIQGRDLVMYDYTPQQYAALARLVAGLHSVFPLITLSYPENRTAVLSASELAAFRGILGHYHVSSAKVDPGPAMQWDRLLSDARAVAASPTGKSPIVPPGEVTDSQAEADAGAIVAAVVLPVVIVALLCLACFLFLRRRGRQFGGRWSFRKFDSDRRGFHSERETHSESE